MVRYDLILYALLLGIGFYVFLFISMYRLIKFNEVDNFSVWTMMFFGFCLMMLVVYSINIFKRR